MKIDYELLKRFKLFGFGFSIGIVLLVFFFNGKKSRCNWFPNERVLAIIRNKHIEYSDNLHTQINSKLIDSTSINQLLLDGDIDFSKSQVKNKPCRKYWIDGKVNEKDVVLHVKICDSIAYLEKLDVNLD
jgi:ribosome-associated translation inhibitor RaiA